MAGSLPCYWAAANTTPVVHWMLQAVSLYLQSSKISVENPLFRCILDWTLGGFPLLSFTVYLLWTCNHVVWSGEFAWVWDADCHQPLRRKVVWFAPDSTPNQGAVFHSYNSSGPVAMLRVSTVAGLQEPVLWQPYCKLEKNTRHVDRVLSETLWTTCIHQVNQASY